MIIGKIISEHAKRKDEIKWSDDIRGEGIIRINNNLSF